MTWLPYEPVNGNTQSDTITDLISAVNPAGSFSMLQRMYSMYTAGSSGGLRLRMYPFSSQSSDEFALCPPVALAEWVHEVNGIEYLRKALRNIIDAIG